MTPNSLDTPISLLERVKAGDEDAWLEFAKKYVCVLEKWCTRWKIQNSDTLDVIQDTLIAVMLSVSRFQRRGTGSFRAWMKTIAWRCWCDALAKSERGRDQAVLRALHESPVAYQELDDAFSKLAEQELLLTSLEHIRARVEPKSWEAFRLTALESLPAAEVATRLEMNVSAIYAARCRIQRMISQEIKRLDEQ